MAVLDVQIANREQFLREVPYWRAQGRDDAEALYEVRARCLNLCSKLPEDQGSLQFPPTPAQARWRDPQFFHRLVNWNWSNAYIWLRDDTVRAARDAMEVKRMLMWLQLGDDPRYLSAACRQAGISRAAGWEHIRDAADTFIANGMGCLVGPSLERRIERHFGPETPGLSLT